MRQSNLILFNTLIIWASRVLQLVPQLILVPYLIATIGESGYGVYALIWSLLVGIDQLQDSLQQGVVKYSAAFLAEGRIDDVNRTVSSSFVYSLVLGAVAATGIVTAALLWEGPSTDLRFALFLVAGLVLCMMPLTPYVGVIQSRQLYFVGVLANVLSKYVCLGLVVAWFSLARPSVAALLVITIFTLLLARLAQVPVAYRVVPGLKNHPSSFRFDSFRLIAAFGGVTVFIALCNIANTAGVRWLMAALISTSFVAHLAIMLMPGVLLAQIVSAMTITVMPATSAYEATGHLRMLQELLVRSMRYTTIIALAALLVAIPLIKDVLALWVGPKYTFLAPYTLAIFASTAFLMTTSGAHHMLKGLGKLHTTAWMALAGRVIAPIMVLLLVYSISSDPYLAVTSGLVAGNMVWVLLHVSCARNAMQVRLRDFLRRVYIQPFVAAIAIAVPASALLNYGDIHVFSLRVGIAMLSVLAFFAEVYFIIATPPERRQATEIIQEVRRRIITSLRRPSYDKSVTAVNDAPVDG